MPVRIYDISKKLGLENKQVLSKAKELGIAAARVASSSLDKITAEYLEQQLILAHPDLAARPPAVVPLATPAAGGESIVLVTAPSTQVETLQGAETATATALLEPPEAPSVEKSALEAPAHAPIPEVEEVTPAPPPELVAKEPPPPPGPKVGDKVGFIQLPPKPGPKPVEKAAAPKLPPRPVEARKTGFTKRGDIRGIRGAP